jgi:hypothetical protein
MLELLLLTEARDVLDVLQGDERDADAVRGRPLNIELTAVRLVLVVLTVDVDENECEIGRLWTVPRDMVEMRFSRRESVLGSMT